MLSIIAEPRLAGAAIRHARVVTPHPVYLWCIQHHCVPNQPTPLAEIIAVGSEMLTPFRQDTNSLFLTAELNTLGIPVAFKTIVGDSLRHLTDVISIALRRADLVLISGGLGPTEDDLTREALASALGRALRRDNALLQSLRERFAARNIPMPPNNAKQADVLDGAEIIPNPNGSAVGQYLTADLEGRRCVAVLLPGPPRELKPLFKDSCLPRLRAVFPPAFLARRVLRMAVIPESLVDSKTAPVYSAYTDVETTILAGGGEIQLHFACAKPSRDAAEARVDEVARRVAGIMEDDVFSFGGGKSEEGQGRSLPEVTLSMLKDRQLTLAVAESCTGGLLAERLTAVPGSSDAMLGGVVTYASRLKVSLLGVDPVLLKEKGAISEPVARAMAEGVRRQTGASVAIAITGIAGPTRPQTEPDAGKAIGLIYISLADQAGTTCVEFRLAGDRERVRLFATQHALDLLRRRLLKHA